MKQLSELIGTEQGKDIIVVGTGTSLEHFDWSQLNDRVTIALNGAGVIPGYTPTYHLWNDAALVDDYMEHDYAPETKIITTKERVSDLSAIPDYKHFDQFYESALFRINDARPGEEPNYGRTIRRDGEVEFLIPVIRLPKENNGLLLGYTIATTGVQLAWKLGALRIFLLGVDGYSYQAKTYHDGTSQKHFVSESDRGVWHEFHDGRLLETRHITWSAEMKAIKKMFARMGEYEGPFPGPGVYNLNPLSTITAWQKVPSARIGIETEWASETIQYKDGFPRHRK